MGNRSYGAGFLGARHQPLVVTDPARGVQNLKPFVDNNEFAERVGLLEQMEQGFFRTYKATSINDHRTTYQRAVQLMRSKPVRANRSILSPPGAMRERSGSTRRSAGVREATCSSCRSRSSPQACTH